MLDSLAHRKDPYPVYAELRERGVHRVADGRWVVARAAGVASVLASPAAAVGFAPARNDPGGVVQARMARFSDGDDHDRRRAPAVARLAAMASARLRARAHELAKRTLRGHAELDVMTALARRVPVAVLVGELGGVGDNAAEVVTATCDLALALAPPKGEPPGDPLAPAGRLADLLGLGPRTELTDLPGLPDPSEAAINVIALLFQAMDATAGLIGNAVVALHRFGVPAVDDLVAETNRFDPPVQLTNRVTTETLTVDEATVPAGQRIVVLLAAANRDPCRFERPDVFDPGRRAAAFTFGSGDRRCPGAAHALALAAGVLDALVEAGATLVEPAVVYEPRPNLRIPQRLMMRMP